MNQRALHEHRSEAVTAHRRGDLQAAKASYFQALASSSAREDEYLGVISEMREVLVRMGDNRGALTVDWYAGNERSQRPLLDQVPAIDRARTLLSWAERSTAPDRGRALFVKAAEEYEAAGLIARAAIACEKATDFIRARALWSRLTQVISGNGVDLYAGGLARFNLARTSLRVGEKGAARQALVAAVHCLEEAADRYETIGQRERAFDCYQVLLAIGKESGEFEHVLEGYVNVIRILREDHLRYYALQSYEEALAVAEKQGETSAAATIARELAMYARKEGMNAIANFGMISQARLWQEVAQKVVARQGPPEIAENALLAAVIAFGESGQFARVAGLYGELAKLNLAEGRVQHYTRARARYDNVQDVRIEAEPLPKHLRHDAAFPDVWHVDLVEWEQKGSASEAAGDVILDAVSWSETMRRRAILVRLAGLSFEARIDPSAAPNSQAAAQAAGALCEQIEQVELYTFLSPLEALFKRPEPAIRAAVVKALGRFLFKRTFITIREGISDPDPTVKTRSAESLEELRFGHAFDPLARIYRESTDPRVRISTIRALSRIDTVEAAEMLLGVIQHDGPDERAAAVEALKRARVQKFVEVARGAFAKIAPDAQTLVREIFQGRGIAA